MYYRAAEKCGYTMFDYLRNQCDYIMMGILNPYLVCSYNIRNTYVQFQGRFTCSYGNGMARKFTHLYYALRITLNIIIHIDSDHLISFRDAHFSELSYLASIIHT